MVQKNNPWADRDLEKSHDNHEPSVEEEINQAEQDLDAEIADVLQTQAETKQDNPLQQKLTEAHEQLLRAHAEMENLRRRTQQEIGNASKYALEKFVDALIPVTDSLEQSITSAQANDPILEGVKLTYKLFQDVLVKFGVRIIDPLNEKFNPQLHEAMSMQSTPGVEPNIVLVVYQKGYVLNDRLIRPARVVVSA